MKTQHRKLLQIALCLLMILSLFSGCAQDEDIEPTVPRLKLLRKKAEILTVAAVEEDFELLEDCINLQYLDLTGNTCYDLILEYTKNHPNVEVVYTAPLGKLMLSNSETQAALEPETYDISTLKNQLKYLPRLTGLSLPKTTLTAEELASLQESFPNLQITYSVALLGNEYLPDCTAADFSTASPSDLPDLINTLPLLPALKGITLPQSLSMEDVRSLMDQFPDITFHYTFQFFGQFFPVWVII